MKEKILIKDLRKSFGPKVVLDGLDLAVFESEILCIVGISGVGKSVILKNLIGILEPDGGSIFVDGIEFTGADTEIRRSILSKYGILFQGAALFDS
ncbi:MAG: ATP-binding cassette domain-containing protein, partial [Chrysiogenales bacterium]